MKIAANKVLAEEVHQFHIVLERLQPLASVVGETGGVFDDGVNHDSSTPRACHGSMDPFGNTILVEFLGMLSLPP